MPWTTPITPVLQVRDIPDPMNKKDPGVGPKNMHRAFNIKSMKQGNLLGHFGTQPSTYSALFLTR